VAADPFDIVPALTEAAKKGKTPDERTETVREPPLQKGKKRGQA